MHRWSTLVLLLVGCAHDWDQLDPRKRDASADVGDDAGGSGVVPDGLVLHLPLEDEGGTLVRDAVSGELLGSVSGATHMPGVVDDALFFEPEDFVMVTPRTFLDLGDAYSVAFFLRPETVNDGSVFVSCNVVPQFSVSQNGGELWGSAYRAPEPDWPAHAVRSDSTETLEDNVWQHVALVVDGVELEIFVDGASVGTATIPVADRPDDSVGWCYLGQSGYEWSRDFYTGGLDDVRIYDRPLSPAEVEALASQ